MAKLTAIFFLLINSVMAQTVMNPGALKTNAILTTVDNINKETGLTTKALNTEQFLDKPGESGQLVGYFKDGHLLKMNVRIGMTNCIRTDKYYLQHDSLIMFYRQERAYSYNEETKTYDPVHLTTSLECRYYYDDHTLLKTEQTGAPKCSEKPSPEQAEEMITLCNKYIRLLRKK